MSKHKYITNVQLAVDSGIWPQEKPITSASGLPELEALGYKLFYIGGNSNLYFRYDEKTERPLILMVRTDKMSAFGIPLSLEIPQIGVLKTAISNRGYDFAEEHGIQTARLNLPDNIPEGIAQRAQLLEMCQPIGVEFYFTNYMTGLLYQYHKLGQDPHQLVIPRDVGLWEKLPETAFAPSRSSEPLNSDAVAKQFKHMVESLNNIFYEFSQRFEKQGVMVPDLNFRIFCNHKNTMVLSDALLCSESARFITAADFEAERYDHTLDKQVLRQFGEEQGWKQKAKKLKKGEVLQVKVPDNLKTKIFQSYLTVLDMFSNQEWYALKDTSKKGPISRALFILTKKICILEINLYTLAIKQRLYISNDSI